MEMMSNAERAQFLRFCWGRSRLPLSLEDFGQRLKLKVCGCCCFCRICASESFVIWIYHLLMAYCQALEDPDPDNSFPSAHTCLFSLDLPNYSFASAAYKKIVYAIFNTSSIDGDGTSAASASQQLGFGFSNNVVLIAKCRPE